MQCKHAMQICTMFKIFSGLYKNYMRCFAMQKILANIHYRARRTLCQPLRGRKVIHAKDSRST